jgi:hypothetical protein
MNKQAIIEGLKELGRIALISAVPIIILSLETATFDYKALFVAVAVAVLKAIDKLIHKSDIELNGLVPF